MAKAARAKVNARKFLACLECVSRDGFRYYLQGVCIQPHPTGGAVLVGTDGHRMIVIHDPTGHCEAESIVRMDNATARQCAKAAKDSGREVTIDADGVVSFDDYRGTSPSIIDDVYPDWARTLRPILKSAKAKAPLSVASFNGGYLGSFGKIAGILSGEKVGAIQIAAFSDRGPALIIFPSHGDALGVVMPMITRMPPIGPPAFMQPIMRTVKRPAPAKKATHKPARKAPARKPSRRAA